MIFEIFEICIIQMTLNTSCDQLEPACFNIETTN